MTDQAVQFRREANPSPVTDERLGATLTVIEGGSHSIALSRPDEVAAVIIAAAESLG